MIAKLTLEKAIEATQRSIRRSGDLVVFSAPLNQYQVFAPSLDLSIRKFLQPETENYPRKLYKQRGHIASLEKLSDSLLALFYNFQGGQALRSRDLLVCDFGDPKPYIDLYQDMLATKSLEWLENPENRLAVSKDALVACQKLLPNAEKGKKFPSGKPEGSLSPLNRSIQRLLSETPRLKNEELWRAIKSKPPKGHEFISSRSDLIKDEYVEYKLKNGNIAQTKYKAFCSSAATQRKKLLKKS